MVIVALRGTGELRGEYGKNCDWHQDGAKRMDRPQLFCWFELATFSDLRLHVHDRIELRVDSLTSVSPLKINLGKFRCRWTAKHWFFGETSLRFPWLSSSSKASPVFLVPFSPQKGKGTGCLVNEQSIYHLQQLEGLWRFFFWPEDHSNLHGTSICFENRKKKPRVNLQRGKAHWPFACVLPSRAFTLCGECKSNALHEKSE